MEIIQPVRLVAIDTQVFKENQYNYQSRAFKQMGELVSNEKIHVLLTQITEQEILNHLQEEVQAAKTAFKALHKGFRDKGKIVYNSEKFKQLLNLSFSEDELLSELKEQFYSFVRELEIEIIKLDDVSPGKIFYKYFHNFPPFKKGQKKHEFPDAFSIEAIEEKAKIENQKIYVVSGDSDWKKACEDSKNIIYFESLDKLLEEIIREENSEDLGLYYKALNTAYFNIKEEIKRQFVNFEFDLKGDFIDFASEEIRDIKVDSDSINIIEISIISIDSLKPEHRVVTFELNAEIIFTVDIAYDSTEIASWDSEDQMYYNTEYTEKTLQQTINIPVEGDTFLIKDEKYEFHLDKIDNICLDPNKSLDTIVINIDF